MLIGRHVYRRLMKEEQHLSASNPERAPSECDGEAAVQGYLTDEQAVGEQ